MMNNNLTRRRFVLRTAGGTLGLPALASLPAHATEPVLATTGAGVGAKRFVAVGNLLGFQLKHFFPTTTGKDYEETPLLKPLAANRDKFTLYRGLDHGIRGGAVLGVVHRDVPARGRREPRRRGTDAARSTGDDESSHDRRL